jgi:hypothetical protein
VGRLRGIGEAMPGTCAKRAGPDRGVNGAWLHTLVHEVGFRSHRFEQAIEPQAGRLAARLGFHQEPFGQGDAAGRIADAFLHGRQIDPAPGSGNADAHQAGQATAGRHVVADQGRRPWRALWGGDGAHPSLAPCLAWSGPGPGPAPAEGEP